MSENTGGGLIICHKCHTAAFSSYALRTAHLTVCRGKLYVVRSDKTELQTELDQSKAVLSMPILRRRFTRLPDPPAA